jgi:hypothetical protein
MQRTFRDVRVNLLVSVAAVHQALKTTYSSATSSWACRKAILMEVLNLGQLPVTVILKAVIKVAVPGDDGNTAREGRCLSRYERTRSFNLVAESRLQLKLTRELRADDYALRQSTK